ncbi:AMIN-like domain-containing (lipo)protein [Hyalangium minutum]|uniref:AMIN-like domain-containing protein n=1 Tax=Hyalangium minutum TaxID=394096 RepID=A0A085WJV8_9BACT|nr:hypothetical protein [Hyalangium minutum]KFE67971.1 hypothetical protein DB31_7208 [Hyalangium minutum]
MMQTLRLNRWMKSLWLVGCLSVVGCTKKDEPAATPPEPVVQAPSAPTEAPPPPPSQPAPSVPADAAAPPAQDSAQPPAPAPAPAQGAGVPEDPKNREWTAGAVKLKRPEVQMVTLRSVRAARNEGFDRVVFEFDGAQVPGYQLEYVNKPIVKCGSGNETEVAGQGWLQVTLTPAQAHEGGTATINERERKSALPVIQELEMTCDFEGEVTWVLGNAHPNKYRVMELRDPTRLVVDVQH